MCKALHVLSYFSFLCDNLLLQKCAQRLCENTIILCVNLIERPENSKEFYINPNGEVEATRCSASLSGRIRNASDPDGRCGEFMANGLPSGDCSFEDDVIERDPDARLGSLMYRPSLKHVKGTRFIAVSCRKTGIFASLFIRTIITEFIQVNRTFKEEQNDINF